MRIVKLTILSLWAVLLISCVEKKPQQPSQWLGKEVKVDSAQLALLELNQKMVVTADDLLAKTVQTFSEKYALYNANTWIYFINRGNIDAPPPIKGEKWTIHTTIYSLTTRKLLIDTLQEYTIGKGELIVAIENNIHEFRKGTKARMLVPWYAAYGMQGTKEVPPYENVIIEIEIKE